VDAAHIRVAVNILDRFGAPAAAVKDRIVAAAGDRALVGRTRTSQPAARKRANVASSVAHVAISVGISLAVRTSWEVSGSRARVSTTTRPATRGPGGRAVNNGSSASAVPMPTRMPSTRPRSSWTRRREASLEIHFESPVLVAILPSSVIAHLACT
jgi:hypothetical protein